MALYRLSKSGTILKWGCDGYKSNYKHLTPAQKERTEELLGKLDQAVLKGDRQEASDLAHQLETYGADSLKKPLLKQITDFIVVVFLAVLFATLLRQVVFEAYEIPTGSMRPTFREQDDVLVSKTAFGINMPFSTDHLYFDPALVQRTGIVIFSGDNIDLQDTDSHYLWVFPYKKRYVKRLMGKPGDTVYFYGGKIYGMDREGNALPELNTSPWLDKITHVPFINMEGMVSRPKRNEFVYSQMHEQIGRINLVSPAQISGEIFTNNQWIKDDVNAAKMPHDSIKTYSDFWGFKNYAQSRLLSKAQISDQKDLDKTDIGEGLLYLELRHTPYLNNPNPLFQQNSNGVSPVVSSFTTTIPLQQKHIDALMDHMYTARFVVRDGKATRYSFDKPHFNTYSPDFSYIPDGTYEFYNGVATQIGMGSIEYELSKDHPIYSHKPEHVQKLYNMGIEFYSLYEPSANNQLSYPSRITFFRNGELYTMGGVLFAKEDPLLEQFNKREAARQEKGSYVAFKDHGAPLAKDGSLNKEFMKAFGLKIPDGHYLTLGDNHAMSADSRQFGFVPQANLQGAPSFTLWPPGSRWGCPPQKPYHWFNCPTVFIWTILGLIALVWYILHRRALKTPQFKKID